MAYGLAHRLDMALAHQKRNYELLIHYVRRIGCAIWRNDMTHEFDSSAYLFLSSTTVLDIGTVLQNLIPECIVLQYVRRNRRLAKFYRVCYFGSSSSFKLSYFLLSQMLTDVNSLFRG